MKEKIIFCWLGTRDERASKKEGEDPLGPIARALTKFPFHEVIILHTSDKPGDAIENYVQWLQALLQEHEKKVVITTKKAAFLNSTDFEAIYKTACAVISEKLDEYKENVDLTFHSTPGSPAMTAIWILLAKSIFPAELIETHKDGTAKIIDFPFDISADFVPSLLKRRDQSCVRLSAGLADDAPEFADIIHRSETMQHAVLRARRVAPHSIPVLIEGESGTGKELFARAIHNGSCRKDKPFVAINCGAIPVALVESELFGHEKGAFTGAEKARSGYFEAANTGTIFLDEIGELPKDMQVKLLRPLQEFEIQRIGAAQRRKKLM